MRPAQSLITDRIARAAAGTVFTSKDFLDLGSRAAVDQALLRLSRSGHLVRIARGIYHRPRAAPNLGIAAPPDLDAVAEALARQTGSRVIPSGAVAANRLGLSAQVPATPVYLTDGRPRRLRLGNTIVHLKRVPPKEFPQGDRMNAMVLQALRFLGKNAITSTVLETLRQLLTPQQRADLVADARYASGWIADAVRMLGDDHGAANG